MKKGISLFAFLALTLTVFGQSISLQGYVYESDNRGYIRQAKVDILELTSKAFITSVLTDKDGFFKAEVPAGKTFLVRAEKDLFQRKEMKVDATDKKPGEKQFINIEVERKPGYIFDVTLANPRDTPMETTDGIHGATIEVFNNTTEKEMVRLPDYEFPNFKVNNVEMKPIILDEKTKLDNIIYASGSAQLNSDAKAELQKVADLLRDNPGMKVELSSHTDSRGKSDMNMKLSQERARVASEYVASYRGVDLPRVKARGYGETRLDNTCSDGVECNERQHRRNRRTEIKILEFNQAPQSRWKPLAELKRLEKMEETLAALQNQEVYQVPVDATQGADIPDDLKKQLGIKEETASDEDKAATPKPTFDKKDSNTKPSIKVSSKPTPPAKPEVEETEEVIEMVKTSTKPQESIEDIERRIEQQAAMSQARKVEIEDNVVVEELEVAQSKFMDMKKLPESYNGFMIQVQESAERLPDSHELFKVFGNLTMEETDEGYAYLMGDFKEAGDAERFLNTIIKPRYPVAKLIKFESGRRLVYQQ